MIKRSPRYYLLSGLVVLTVGVIFLLGYAVTQALEEDNEALEDVKYVSYEVLTDNTMPVLNQTEEQTDEIMKPYTAENVEIGKNYYDYEAEETNQEGSIIYYENTYIQNTGVDYTS